MARNEKTSARVASLAGKVLANPKSPKTAKTLVASVLTQAPDKPKRSASAKPRTGRR